MENKNVDISLFHKGVSKGNVDLHELKDLFWLKDLHEDNAEKLTD